MFCARCWWRSWLRHCATSRKVVGSIPDGVIGIFLWHNPSGRTMALGSTQALTEMSTRNISWGVKAAGVWGWQPYHFHVLIVLKSGSIKLLEPSGLVQACNWIVFVWVWYWVLRIKGETWARGVSIRGCWRRRSGVRGTKSRELRNEELRDLCCS